MAAGQGCAQRAIPALAVHEAAADEGGGGARVPAEPTPVRESRLLPRGPRELVIADAARRGERQHAVERVRSRRAPFESGVDALRALLQIGHRLRRWNVTKRARGYGPGVPRVDAGATLPPRAVRAHDGERIVSLRRLHALN
uniref:Uncharacterized protein n=1 Tax=Calcidiscus leptoporus TaxID=127549 RepID=A0A7S0J2X8_9EUKA